MSKKEGDGKRQGAPSKKKRKWTKNRYQLNVIVVCLPTELVHIAQKTVDLHLHPPSVKVAQKLSLSIKSITDLRLGQ